MLTKNSLILSLLLGILITAISCTQKADSLPSKDSLLYEGYKYLFTDTVKCLKIQRNTLQNAKYANNKDDITLSYLYLTITYINMHNPKTAQLYADSAYMVASNTKSKKSLGYAYMAIGLLRSYVIEDADFETLNYLFNAYSILNGFNEFQKLTRIAVELSYIYGNYDFEKTEKYAFLSIENAKKSPNLDDYIFGRTAFGYFLLLKAAQNKNLVDSAINYYKNTIWIIEKNKDSIYSKNNWVVAYANLAVLYYENKMPGAEHEFLKYLNTAIQLAKQYDIKNAYRNMLGLKGSYYIEKKDLKSAKKILLSGIQYQKSLPYSDYFTLYLFYSQLKKIALTENNHKKYYEYDTTLTRYNQLSINDKILQAIENANVKYETTIKANKITSLEQQYKLESINKWLGYTLAIILAMSLLIIFRLYIFRKKYFSQKETLFLQKQANSEMELELKKREALQVTAEKLLMERKLLQSQMDPHFVSNALMSIQGFILEQDSKNAINYLSKFSKLMRQILQHSKADKVLLDDEVATLENYIIIQQLKLADCFNYSIHTNNLLNNQIHIPPMLIQPFIENAIEHGLLPLNTRKGMLVLSFEEDATSKNIICTIDDNGIGLEQSKLQKGKSTEYHKSMAIQIAEERLVKLIAETGTYHGHGIEIIDKTKLIPHSFGTKVLIKIPIIN